MYRQQNEPKGGEKTSRAQAAWIKKRPEAATRQGLRSWRGTGTTRKARTENPANREALKPSGSTYEGQQKTRQPAKIRMNLDNRMIRAKDKTAGGADSNPPENEDYEFEGYPPQTRHDARGISNDDWRRSLNNCLLRIWAA